MITCQVETYSGFRLHERPRRFTWGEEWLEVRRVVERWSGPDHLYFKVVAGDGRIFLLTYQEQADAWEVKLMGPQG
ncbi:MAG: hypothetical protein Q8M54_00960 [Desulfobaccales bacterium]|nr:hypothetical protein [Desulfobaccales bacterium]